MYKQSRKRWFGGFQFWVSCIDGNGRKAYTITSQYHVMSKATLEVQSCFSNKMLALTVKAKLIPGEKTEKSRKEREKGEEMEEVYRSYLC